MPFFPTSVKLSPVKAKVHFNEPLRNEPNQPLGLFPGDKCSPALRVAKAFPYDTLNICKLFPSQPHAIFGRHEM